MQGLPQMPLAASETSRLVIANNTTFVASTEGRPALPAGQTTNAQVLTSEPLQQGQGQRVQVQLGNGEKVNLITEKPLPEGQSLQLTGRAEGRVEVRVLSQAAVQQAANNLISQTPAIKVQLSQGQTLPLQAGQATRAEVLTSQPAANGQGYTAKIQLSTGQQVDLTSSQPLPAKSAIHLSHTQQGELEVRLLSREASQLLDQVKLPLTALPSAPTTAPAPAAPTAPPPASLQSLLTHASNQLRQTLGNPTTLQTEGRSVLAAGQAAIGQVKSSEALQRGQGQRVQVQLSNEQQLNLIAKKPMHQGLQLQLMGRAEGQVEVRVLSQPAIQQLATSLLSQTPAIKVQLPQGQTLPLQAGQATRAEVLTSQPAANGQGYTAKIQLSTGQQVNLTSSQPLPANTPIHLSKTAQGELEVRPLNRETSQVLDQLKLPLTAIPNATLTAPTPPSTPPPPPVSLQTLLSSASSQLRQMLGSPTNLQTEGRPVLTQGQVATGQVMASEPLPQGQGHRVQVQLSNGQHLNLIADKPLPEGQQLQLTGRAEGRVEVRVLSQPAIQQLATSLLSQTPAIKVQLPQGQTLPLQAGQATRAEVLTSQPAANGQGYTAKIQLSTGQQVNLTSSQPLPANTPIHLSKTAQGELEVRPLNRETSQVLDQLKLPLTALPSSSVTAPTTATPPTPAASLQTLLASAGALLRNALSGSTNLQTEGRPVLTQGQVRASEPLSQGQGHRVQVQLSNGQQLNLIADKPLPEGQQLQLTGRAEGQVEARPAPQAALQQAAVQQAVQQAANNLISQLPAIKVQLPQGQTLPLQASQATRAEVLTSQPAANGQGYTAKIQLSTGQQVNLTSSQPLPANTPIHLSKTAQGELEVRPLNRETSQVLDQLKLPLTAVTNPISKATTPSNNLQTLLDSASTQLRYALPKQTPLAQSMQQLTQLVRQLTPASGLPAANTTQASVTSTLTSTTKGSELSTTNSSSTVQNTSASASNKVLTTLSNQLTAALGLIPQGNQTPSAASLQQFIPFSGLLLEANLLNGIQTNPAGGDLKLLLQQASVLLREGLANTSNTQPRQQLLQQLSQQVQSAESRIQTLQQNSLQATQAAHDRGQPAQIVQLDLPYSVRGDWFQAQLEIRHWIEEKDAEAALDEMEKKTRSWEVQLGFTLANWGKIHTLLRLKGEVLKASVWIETEESFGPIKNQAELLAARLRRLGADVEEVSCYLGTPPPLTTAENQQQIIDTRI